MAITTQFINDGFGVFNVYDDGIQTVYQPFKPTPDGSMQSWTEEEALEWWSKEKSSLINRSKYNIDENNEIVEINTGR